jgi:uncharacterized protein
MSSTLDMILTNAIYSGKVRHARYVDAKHEFQYAMHCLWLSVSEVDQPTYRWPLIGRGLFGMVTLRAGDYLAGRCELTLKQRIQAEIKEKTDSDWDGDAYLLAQPRYFGFVMNPLALYYCFTSSGQLAYIVGEITNTPWGERHCYVFKMGQGPQRGPESFVLSKEFHVSPFLPMQMEYTWRLSEPGRYLSVGIWNRVKGRLDFEAHMTLERSPLTFYNMMIKLIKMPLMTWKIWFGIYLNAGILYAVKRVTFYSHPKKLNTQKGDS